MRDLRRSAGGVVIHASFPVCLGYFFGKPDLFLEILLFLPLVCRVSGFT